MKSFTHRANNAKIPLLQSYITFYEMLKNLNFLNSCMHEFNKETKKKTVNKQKIF